MKYLRILIVVLLAVGGMFYAIESCDQERPMVEVAPTVVSDPFTEGPNKPPTMEVQTNWVGVGDTLVVSITQGHAPYTLSLQGEGTSTDRVPFSNSDTILSFVGYANGLYQLSIQDARGRIIDKNITYTKVEINCENELSKENLINQVRDKVGDFHNYLNAIGDTIKRTRSLKKYTYNLNKILGLFISDTCTITINSGMNSNDLKGYKINFYVEKKIFKNPRYSKVKVEAGDFHLIENWTRDPTTNLLTAKVGYQLRYRGIQLTTENRDIPVTVEQIAYEDLNYRIATVHIKTKACEDADGIFHEKGCCEILFGNIATILPKE